MVQKQAVRGLVYREGHRVAGCGQGISIGYYNPKLKAVVDRSGG
jgi:hypothetical protein